MKAHPAAGIFPLLEGPEFAELCESVRALGLKVDIVTYEGKVLDGRNRLRACKEVGRDPRFVEWDGLDSDGNPVSPDEHVWALNSDRRHYASASQRAALKVKSEERAGRWRARQARLQAKANKARSESQKGKPKRKANVAGNVACDVPKRGENKTRKALAKAAKVGERTAQDVLSVKAKDPGLFEEIAKGKTTASKAKRELKARERAEARRDAAKASAKLPSVYGSVADVLADVRSGELPRFACIYADPPWRYENSGTKGAAENHYPTLSIDELKALPIAELAAGDCYLHMWATSPLLPEQLGVLVAWGFRYVSSFVWAKEGRLGIGNHWRTSHEFLLTAKRGSLTADDRSIRSWLSLPAGRHSEKPEEIRALVERLGPGPRLELFGRRAVKGWVVMGNEVSA